MPYHTMNPVPSTDPRDLYDNAGITDKFVNGTEPFVPDRLGLQRRTWEGMEVDFNNAQAGRQTAFDQFLESSAFIWIGDYATGLTFASRSQYMVRDGAAYRIATSTTLPYTATGNWALEQNKFSLVNSDDILRQDLSAPDGAGLVHYSSDQTYPSGSVGAELQVKKAIYVVQGLHGDGINDDAPAINAALLKGGIILLPKPTESYLIASALEVSVAGTWLMGAGAYTTVIKKGFNGEAARLTGHGTKLSSIGIAGEGATYNGGGVKPIGYNCLVSDCRIVDTSDSPVVFDAAVGSGAAAGTYCVVERCFLLPRDLVNGYAARSLGTDDSVRPTARTFRDISGGGPLIDFSGMNSVVLTDSFGTSVKFSAGSGKVKMLSCRITSASKGVLVLGVGHVLDNNIFGFGDGFGLTIDASCANVLFGSGNILTVGTNSMASPIMGNAIGGTMPNNIYTNLISYISSFVWGGSTSPGSFGNSSVSAYYKLSGRACYASFAMVRGSSAVLPVGTWIFKLPYKANVTAIGAVMLKSSSGTFQVGVVEVQGGSADALVYLHGTNSALNDGTVAFATNATLEFTINYLVSPA